MQIRFYESISKIYQKLVSYVQKPCVSDVIYVTLYPLKLRLYDLSLADGEILTIDRQVSPKDISSILDFGLDVSEERKIIRDQEDITPLTLQERLENVKN